MFEVIVSAFSIMLASLAGVFFLSKTAKTFLENRLSQLVAFSAGVFLFVAGALALEALHLSDSWLEGVVLIVIGYIIAWALHALLPETHHHHSPACDREHGKAAKKLIVGDAIHNVADGIVLITAFNVSLELGVAATISIFIHEAIQEVSEFFVLRRAGYSVKRALLINFAVSSTILLGVLLGYLALASSDVEVLLLALSAGFFLHVVAHDLLPKRKSHDTRGKFLQHLSLVLVGVLLMWGVQAATGDSHVHGDHDGHGHDEREHAHDDDSEDEHHDHGEENIHDDEDHEHHDHDH